MKIIHYYSKLFDSLLSYYIVQLVGAVLGDVRAHGRKSKRLFQTPLVAMFLALALVFERRLEGVVVVRDCAFLLQVRGEVRADVRQAYVY